MMDRTRGFQRFLWLLVLLSSQLNPGLVNEDLEKAKEMLSKTQGALVAMPLRFLEKENLLPDFGTAEALAPDALVT